LLLVKVASGFFFEGLYFYLVHAARSVPLLSFCCIVVRFYFATS
jgi:hypothetical protein